MLPSSLRRLSAIVLCFGATISQAQVFNWADVETDNGKCSDEYISDITSWLDDAKTLVEAALDATAQIDTGDENILAFFTSYFGIQWDYSTAGAFQNDQSEIVFVTVKSTLNAISTFLNGGGLSIDAAGSASAADKQPYGYCGSDNYQAYNWYDTALLMNGEEYPGGVTVAELFSIFNGQGNPYWAKTEQGYAFSAGDPCVVETDEAGTTRVALAFVSRPYIPDIIPPTDISEARLYGPAMAVCDPMLTGVNLPDSMVDSLDDLKTAYPTKDDAINLDEKIPKGAAIFHELTHLTTDYVKDQWYPLDMCIEYAVLDAGATTVSPQNNANSYMFFALAVWYYQNPQNGFTATFYRGNSNDAVKM